MTRKIKILFFLYKAKLNKNDKAPIYCRLTHNKERRQFSTGYFIPLETWDSKTKTVDENYYLSSQINERLLSIERTIFDLILKYEINKNDYTLDEVWNEITGNKKDNVKCFIQAFDMHNEEVESLIGKSYTIGTYKKFISIRNQLQGFINSEYNQADILLSNVKLKFILNFETYLLTKKNMKQISVNKTIQRTRKIIRYAIAHELLEKDPFALYKPKSVKTNVVYLSPEELKVLENYTFDLDRLSKVRDCFVFCCYTGLPYTEMATLKRNHIYKGFDNNDWIKIYRKKTDKTLNIPLLPQAALILEKYQKSSEDNEYILPRISNQKFNKYLKEIAYELGISKKLTHHIARKTFASTVLLYNDVPMEIVSELLGHSNIKITQKHYAKVANKKVSSQISKLADKLKNKS